MLGLGSQPACSFRFSPPEATERATDSSISSLHTARCPRPPPPEPLPLRGLAWGRAGRASSWSRPALRRGWEGRLLTQEPKGRCMWRGLWQAVLPRLLPGVPGRHSPSAGFPMVLPDRPEPRGAELAGSLRELRGTGPGGFCFPPAAPHPRPGSLPAGRIPLCVPGPALSGSPQGGRRW